MRLFSAIPLIGLLPSISFAGMHLVLEPVSSVSGFVFAGDSDYDFRFLEFNEATIEDSDYLLIEDLSPLEEGGAWCVGNYQGARSSDGSFSDEGAFMVNAPGLASGEGVYSPVVGIVPRSGDWDAYGAKQVDDTSIAYADGIANASEGTLSILARKKWPYVSGSIAYDVLDEETLALEASTLSYEGQSYQFLSTNLTLEEGTLTGLLISADELNDYESVLFKVTISELFDGDHDGIYDLFDETPESCDFETLFSDCPASRKYSLFGLISDEYFYSRDVGYLYMYQNHGWFWVFGGAQLEGSGMYLWSWNDSAYLWTNSWFYPYCWNFSTAAWQLF